MTAIAPVPLLDDPAVLRGTTPEDAVRQLRLQPYGDGDPLA